MRLGTTIVFVSHDLAVVRSISAHIVVMETGAIRESGDTADIFELPRDAYTRALRSTPCPISGPPTTRGASRPARTEMPADTEHPTVAAADLTQRVVEVMGHAGLPPAHAATVAHSLVDADLRGTHSHGVGRADIYVERLRRGGNIADGEPALVVDAPAAAVLDGRDLLSQIPSAAAVALAAAKAGDAGCATVVVRGGSHFGAAGYWARLLAERGLVAIASTNTTPLMAPWGGATAAIGTNPLAIAFPSAELRRWWSTSPRARRRGAS